MASTNAACPYCGEETLVTIPSGKKLKYVRKSKSGKGLRSTAYGQKYGRTFHAYAK